VNVGAVANTNDPVPVSSVMAEIKLAELGVAKNVAIPVPNPEIPVDTGSPVQLDNVPELGVPKAPPFTTTAPAEPVFTANAVATPVPNPLTPVEMGRPVQLDNVPDDGVPSTGVVNVGLVNVLFVNVSEPANVTKVPVVGNVIVVEPDVVRVRAFAPESVNDAPEVPRLVMLFALLSNPFFATKRFDVAMILYPLGEILCVNC